MVPPDGQNNAPNIHPHDVHQRQFYQQFAGQYALGRHAYNQPPPLQQYAPPYGGHAQPIPLQPYPPQLLGQYMQPHRYALPHVPPVLPPVQGYHTPYFNLAPAPPAPPAAPAPLPRQRPNDEPRPGVFNFRVDVLSGKVKCEFSAETDTSWPDFERTVAVYLGKNTELMYKVTGDNGRGSYLKTGDDFKAAMERLCQRAYGARTRAVALEIRDMAKPNVPDKSKKRQRERENDIPSSDDPSTNTQLQAYKQLEASTRCEEHRGHCFIDRVAGRDNHHRLDHSEIGLWAKKISLGQATIYNPPHCLNFDRGPTKKPRLPSHLLSSASSTIPEVHVTIQNITPEASQGTSNSTSSDHALSTITNRTSQKAAYTPSTGHFSPHFSPPPYSAMMEAGYLPSLHGSQAAFQPFPPMQDVVKLVEADKPGHQFGRLVEFLLEAGIFSSEQILLCPEDVLCVIGDMGLAHARILRNYAKRIVLPVLGLQGNYEEPDVTMHQPSIDKSHQTATHQGEGSSNWQWDNDGDLDELEGVDDYDSDSIDGLDVEEKDYCVSFSRGRSLSC